MCHLHYTQEMDKMGDVMKISMEVPRMPESTRGRVSTYEG